MRTTPARPAPGPRAVIAAVAGLATPAFGQLNQLFDASGSVTPLPDPPRVEHMLLESPWLAIGAVVFVGAIAMVALARGDKRKQATTAGVVAAVIAGGIYAASVLVTTPRESVADATSRLVQATVDADVPVLRELLDDEIVLDLRGARTALDRDSLIARVELVDQTFNPESVRIREMQAASDSDIAARTQTNIVVSTGSSAPTGMWCRLLWTRESDGAWRVYEIHVLWVAGVPENSTLRLP